VTDTITLYTMPGACSLADHIALRWAGAEFEVVVLDHAALKQPEFLAINPAGAVPALKVGDWVLTQNVAILNYIADRFPQARLVGDGSAQSRAEVNRWLALLNADLHTSFPPLFGASDWLGEEKTPPRPGFGAISSDWTHSLQAKTGWPARHPSPIPTCLW